MRFSIGSGKEEVYNTHLAASGHTPIRETRYLKSRPNPFMASD